MGVISATGVSSGIALGTIHVLGETDLSYTSTPVEDSTREQQRLRDAIDTFIEVTSQQAERVRHTLGDSEADILASHVMMISDPYMHGEMNRLIDEGVCAEDALSRICEQFATMFESSGDELTMARAADVRDIRDGILARLLGRTSVSVGDLPEGSILVTRELTPSMTSEINRDNVVAIVTETGSVTSHAAILARALEIPAVMSVNGACDIPDGTLAIVDGEQGIVHLNPNDDARHDAMRAAEMFREEKEELKQYAGLPTCTASGEKVILAANIGNPEQARNALTHDAEGIGLFRSEFLFLDTNQAPTEDEQYAAYRKVALTMGQRPIIIRTLDVGGDKHIGYLNMPTEDNPFLGFRAIRYCLENPDVFHPQIRALLRAGTCGDIHIMLPLVTSVDEVRRAKEIIADCARELREEGIDHKSDMKVGIMMETPAATLMADVLAREVDFFSIGTNDLIGYTMACDRGNDAVANLYSPYNPAVLRSIEHIIRAGNDAGIMVGMCGEAAADPLLIPLWIAFGLGEYSVSAVSILRTRKEISLWSMDEAQALADEVMALATAHDVENALREARKRH